MPEGLNPIEAGKQLHEHGEAASEGQRNNAVLLILSFVLILQQPGRPS